MTDQYMHATEVVCETALSHVPFIGEFISALLDIFWPQNQVDVWTEIKDKVEHLVNDKISAADYARVQTTLGDASQGSGLVGVLTDYLGAVQKTNGQDPKGTWDSAHVYFIGASASFQQKDEEVLLLPLFAQMANLHLALLRDGVTGGFCSSSELIKYLNAYESYADKWVAKAKSDSAARAGATYVSINAVTRFMQISVLNFRELWPYFDQQKYPAPIKTDIKSKVEIFYTVREFVCPWPYSKLQWNPPPANDIIASIDAYCLWDGISGSDLSLYAGSQITHSQGGPGPYSGITVRGNQPQGLKQGKFVMGGSETLYMVTVKVPASNPIASVRGTYDSTGGVYCIDFVFKDGTSSGDVPSQDGANQHYPNSYTIVPPLGYYLTSLWTPPGGWYEAIADAVFGFRMIL